MNQENTNESHALKQYLAEEERPREKAKKHGFSALSTAELLAILVGSGSAGESVVELCRRMLLQFDNKLYLFARQSIKDLMKFRGIGEVKAIELLAAMELARRYQSEEFLEMPQVTNSDDAYRCLRPLMQDLDHEEIRILILNRDKRVTDRRRISVCGTSAAVGDVKIIFREALEHRADSIILAHNHPSNNLTPSAADNNLTDQVKKGCQAVGVDLVDHIIVSRSGYYSYNDQSRL